MKNILKNAENAEKLLKLTSDTMILLDKDGTCVDIAVHNVDLWFLKEDKLLGKNILRMLPTVTYNQVYPKFQKVWKRKVRSTRNYELVIGNKTYFFKCIMYPYEDMILCQYHDITERSQRKLELEKRNHELNEIQKPPLSEGGGMTLPTRASTTQDIRESCVPKRNRKSFWMPT